MKNSYKYLTTLFLLPFIISCASSVPSSITSLEDSSEIPFSSNEESIQEESSEEPVQDSSESSLESSILESSSEVVEEDIFSKGDKKLTIDGETYYRLADGLYVNQMPGIYEEDFKLKFAYNKNKGELYYNYNGETPFLNSICYLSPFKGLDIYENVPESDDDIPLSISVDEILDSRDNRCVSDNYINSVQNPGKYSYFHNACVVGITFKYGEQKTDLSLSYLVDPTQDYNLPVVFLSMPYRKWFGSPHYFYNNIKEEPDMRVHLEFVDPVNDDYWQRNSKIKLGGGWSKGYPQRTLNLNFNKDENGNKNDKVKSKIFGDRKTCGDQESDLTKFIRFRLHNGGNCFEAWSGFNDAIIQRAMVGTDASTTAYRPCLVYLNGEYWGLMSIREHYSDYYIKQNYDVDDKNVTMFELKGDLIFDDGDEDGLVYINQLKALYNDSRFSSSNQNKVEEAFVELEEMVDIDSLIDVLLANYYACNWDFVGNANNLKMWRAMETSSKPYEDGKWRFCLHDLDFAFSEYTNFMNKNVNYSYNNWGLVKACMRSLSFRTRLVERAEELAQTNLNKQTLIDITSAMYQEVKPYKKDSGKRWGQPNSYYSDWLTYQNTLNNYFTTRSSAFVSELKTTINNQYGGY